VELEMVDGEGNINRNHLAVSGYLAETEAEDVMEELTGGDEALPEEAAQEVTVQGEAAQEDTVQGEAADGAGSVQDRQVLPLDVRTLYEEMLRNSSGDLREVLDSLDLGELEVRSMEQFKDVLTGELELKGFTDKEMRQIISQYFGEGESGTEPVSRKPSWTMWAGIFVAGCGLIWLIIAWWRRRGKREEQED